MGTLVCPAAESTCAVAEDNVCMTEVGGAFDGGRKQLREAHREVCRAMYVAANEVDVDSKEQMPDLVC